MPNQAARGESGPPFFAAYGEWMGTPPPTWEDIAWLRELWGGPFMLKGVMRVDDAKRAVDAGVSAISVSNHGGNNLDGTPASIRALPAIAAAVGDDVEVLLDGGIRRGSDVVKAVALGARAVMIGRASLWGLAANGQAGVENVLDVLRAASTRPSWDLVTRRCTTSVPTTCWYPKGSLGHSEYLAIRPSDAAWRTSRELPGTGVAQGAHVNELLSFAQISGNQLLRMRQQLAHTR